MFPLSFSFSLYSFLDFLKHSGKRSYLPGGKFNEVLGSADETSGQMSTVQCRIFRKVTNLLKALDLSSIWGVMNHDFRNSTDYFMPHATYPVS